MLRMHLQVQCTLLVEELVEMATETWLQPFHETLLATSLGAIAPTAADFALTPASEEQDASLKALRKADQLIRRFNAAIS